MRSTARAGFVSDFASMSSFLFADRSVQVDIAVIPPVAALLPNRLGDLTQNELMIAAGPSMNTKMIAPRGCSGS